MIFLLRHLRVLLCLLPLLDYSSAMDVLPRGEYGELHRAAFAELHNVIINPRGGVRNLFIRGAVPYPRSFHKANRPLKRSTSPLEVRDILLGKRQTCEAGFSLCSCKCAPVRGFPFVSCNSWPNSRRYLASGRCCPNSNGSGRCCDDGTCVTTSETCCKNGGACRKGEDCCENGCKPKQNTCCTGDWNCDPGFKCCGDDNCAEIGGECCENRMSCDKGASLRGIATYHKVLYSYKLPSDIS